MSNVNFCDLTNTLNCLRFQVLYNLGMDQNSQNNNPTESKPTPEQEAELAELEQVAGEKQIYIYGLNGMPIPQRIEELKKAIEEKETQDNSDLSEEMPDQNHDVPGERGSSESPFNPDTLPSDQTDLTDEESKVDLKQSEATDIDLSAVEPLRAAQSPGVDARQTDTTTPSADLNQPNIIGGQNMSSSPQNVEDVEKSKALEEIEGKLKNYGVYALNEIKMQPRSIDILKAVLTSIKESGVELDKLGITDIYRALSADDIYVYQGDKLCIGEDVPLEIIEKFVKYYIAHKDDIEIQKFFNEKNSFDINDYEEMTEGAVLDSDIPTAQSNEITDGSYVSSGEFAPLVDPSLSTHSQDQNTSTSGPVPTPAPATVPVPAPTPASTPAAPAAPTTPIQTPETQDSKDVPEYLTPEQYNHLRILRNDIAKLEAGKRKEFEDGTTIEEIRAEYEEKKKEIAESIKNSILVKWNEKGIAMTPELEQEREKEITTAVFDVLVKGEIDEYNNALRENRKGGMVEKSLGALRSLAGQRTVQWYLKQGKLRRFAINGLVIGGVIGLASAAVTGSATIAAGAVGLRTARAAASLAGSTLGSWVGEKAGMKAFGAKEYAKRLQNEYEARKSAIEKDGTIDTAEREKQKQDLEKEYENKKKDIWNEWLKEEEDKIRNSSDSIEEKTKKLTDVKSKVLSSQRKVAGSKLVGALVGGVGLSYATGAFADTVKGPSGATENRYNGSNKGVDPAEHNATKPSSAATEKGGNTSPNGQTPTAPAETKVEVNSQTKISKGDTAETYNNELGEQESMERAAQAPSAASAQDTAETLKSEPGELDSMMRATEVPKAGGVFESVEKADFVPEKGSTLWGGMGKVLENNDRFAKLSPEGKTFIQSTYLNKAMAKPADFGFAPDPDYKIKVDIGKKINFAKLFEDKDEFEKLIEKAEKLSDAQKGNIRANDEAIANWVKAYPGQKATPEKIDEILSARNSGSKLAENLPEKTVAAESPTQIVAGFEDETPMPEVQDVSVDDDQMPNDGIEGSSSKKFDPEHLASKRQIENAKKLAEESRSTMDQMDKDLAEIKSKISFQDSSTSAKIAGPGVYVKEAASTDIHKVGTGLDMKDVSVPKLSEAETLKGLLDREEQLSRDIRALQQKIENATAKAFQNVGNEKSDDIDQITQDADTLRKMTEERNANSQVIHQLMNHRPKVEDTPPDNFGNIATGAGVMVGATVAGKMFTDSQKSPEQLQKEIDAAKARYAELQNDKPKFGVVEGGKKSTIADYRNNLSAPKSVRSLSGDSESMKVESENVIREALDEEVNAIYDERDWLGRVKTPGTKTADWGLVRGLPAYKVLNFMYKNSKDSGLQETVVKELRDNKRHKKLLTRINEFMEHTNREVRPREDGEPESIEDFLIRLGLKVREMYMEESPVQNNNLKKAA